MPAYLARDRVAADGRRVAFAVSRDASPRPRHLKLLMDGIDNLMMLLAHGLAPSTPAAQGEGYFVICAPPPGPSIAASPTGGRSGRRRPCAAPIARVLAVLQERGSTHRAIRPDNVFESAPGQPVTLGAGLGGSGRHASTLRVRNTSTTPRAHPAGRGEGTTADDVYALGVLSLTLLNGRVLMASMMTSAMIPWKLDLGSFAALTRKRRLPARLPICWMACSPMMRSTVPNTDRVARPASLRGRRPLSRPAPADPAGC